MNKIIVPLNPHTQGPQVADLQDALRQCLDRGALLADQEGVRRELSAALQRERGDQTYGSATEKLVTRFQGERRLEVSGKIDEPTANALNALLREWGLLEAAAAPTARLVAGTVRREDGFVLRGMQVRAFHETGHGPIRLGDDTSDAEGRYTIRYESLPGVDAIHLRVSVVTEGGTPAGSSKVVRNAGPLETVDLTLPATLALSERQIVEGSVMLEHGLPAEQIKLRLYRRDFGGKATLLNETATLAGGRYAFSLEAANPASLEVRAVKDDGSEVALSKPLNELTAETRSALNLVAPGAFKPLAAEYARLSADLAPHVGQMAKLAEAEENAERQDLTVLNRATGWDARLIALASVTEKLAADPDVGLSSEAVYGLLRAGLPSDKRLLAQVDPEVVDMAVRKVRDAGIVEVTDTAIAEIKTKFTAFANRTMLAVPAPGSRSTYGELLSASGLPQDAQDKFASVYLKHRGSGAELWEAAAKAGLSGAHVEKLQLQGKLAFLAGNSEPMTARLLNKGVKNPVELVQQDFHDAATWRNEVFDQAGIPQERRAALTEADRKKIEAVIPAGYAVDTVETALDSYAQDMARKVRLSYPTHVLGRLVETDAKYKLPAAHDDTVQLLKKATDEGFRFGQTPVDAYFRSQMTDGELQAAQPQLRQLKTLQRIYQITPAHEAMPVLASLEITSAFDVMAYPEQEFISLFKSKYLDIHKKPAAVGLPELIVRKAQQVSSITYNLFAIARKLDSDVPLAGMSPSQEVRDGVKNELIKHYPTMESLFGSMDYCECEHCRSVLSPAAYLVDLLQFVDVEPGVWGNYLAQWKAKHGGLDYPHQDAKGNATKPYDALIERRPDLPYIALTCENTNTALPYIDVVNEILEYYVAHGKLEKEAARDTGAATTDELLAEPQNVIVEAYDALRGARHPVGLPFDLWLETVRQFCDGFGTPLHRVLEVFRIRDGITPEQEFDDATAVFMESLGLSPKEQEIFTDPDPLANDDAWHELYGFPSVRADIQNPSNAVDATLSVANSDAARLRAGLAYTFFDAAANRPSAETKIIAAIGANDSAGPGRTTITFSGTWTTAPQAGDLLVCDVRSMMHSAKALSRRLGVTYKEIADIVQTGFVNPELGKLALLYKLGVDIADARFWLANKALLPRDPKTLAPDQQKLRLEAEAFSQRLAALAEDFGVSTANLEADIQAIPFDRVVVLADPDAGCNFDRTTLQYGDGTRADAIVYLRISLFVRLRRKLGWTIEETDRALTTFIPKSAPYDGASAHMAKRPLRTALIYMAHLDALDQKLQVGKQSRSKLLTFWSEIATTGRNPLYAQLFLNRTVLKSDAVFDDRLGNYLSDGDNVDLKDHVLALQGALGLTADEIGRILANVGKSIEEAGLSLENVSTLYRYGLLAKAIKLTVGELIALQQISGIDPFQPLPADAPTRLDEDAPFAKTLDFVGVVEEIKDSGLKVEDLDYLLRHRFDETGKFRPDSAGTLALLKSLAEGIRAIRAEHPTPADPAALSDEVLRQKLGLALPADVVATFMAMLNGTAEYAVTRSVAIADQLRPADFADEPSITLLPYNAVKNEQTLVHRGVLFASRQSKLKAKFGPKLGATQKAVFEQLVDDAHDKAQKEALAFFNARLLKQPAGAHPESGFLDSADYDLLLDPDLPLSVGETTREHRARRQRARLVAAFWPFLERQLVRQLVVQTMTARAGADAALVESLVTDKRLLADSGALLESFAKIAERGLTATFPGVPGAAELVVSDADTGLKDGAGKPLKPAGADSVRFQAHLEVPASGVYRFYVELEKQNSQATLVFPHLPEPIFLDATAAADADVVGDQANEYIELKAGMLYRFLLDLTNLNGGDARMLIEGETLSKGPLSRLTLYPASGLDAADRATTLLNKALLLVQSLGLSEREVRYLLTHSTDFGELNLTDLPTQDVRGRPGEPAGTVRRFASFRRLAAYFRLKRDLAGGTDDLIGIFEANGTAAADRLAKQVYPRIAKLTRRDEATVKAAAETLIKMPAVPSFENEKGIWRLWDALQVIERFGVSPAAINKWSGIVKADTTSMKRFEVARDLKAALKARFDTEGWQRIARPIFDRLRRRQRDALTSHVMQQHGFDRIEQLYEFFLIDPGMEPVVQTSRIRLAISSLQLFVQRCLLNLEPKVHPTAIVNAEQWEWMKRYRVWEANRKIFLFPENWLEPEFRDDKTHLFSELEGALLQGDVSSDLVEDAFLNYLKKLDELARLDIVAMHIEDAADPAGRILHVFGRTNSDPRKHFYRRRLSSGWTPWEPVSAEVEGDHLAPVVWRDRLYLFWVTFLEKASEPSFGGGSIKAERAMSASGSAAIPVSPDPPPKEKPIASATVSEIARSVATNAGTRTVEAQLHWSEYLKGEWTTRESGGFKATLEASGLSTFSPETALVHVSKEYDPVDGEELGVFVHLGGQINQAFYLAGRNSAPEAANYQAASATPPGPLPENKFVSATSPGATRYNASGALTVGFKERITTEPGKASPKVIRAILQRGGRYKLVPCNNNLTALGVSADAYKNATDPAAVKAVIESGLGEIASLVKPVFYQDNRNTFFVESEVVERTIEEWPEYVAKTPPPEPGWKDSEWWKKLIVVPEVPFKARVPDPGDPLSDSIHPDSLIQRAVDRDWLLNPASVVKFGDVLIGPAGQPGIEMRSASALSAGQGQVSVNPASDLAGASAVVLHDAATFARSGLTAVGSGLNVVGAGGFGAALAKNYADLNRSGFRAGPIAAVRVGDTI